MYIVLQLLPRDILQFKFFSFPPTILACFNFLVSYFILQHGYTINQSILIEPLTRALKTIPDPHTNPETDPNPKPNHPQ